MARTPLFALVARALRQGSSARLTRRQFLGAAAALTTVAAAPAWSRTAPRIAIVGGGIAGLAAAWELRKAGLRSTVYEAAARTGGRIMTVRNSLGEGLCTELGGSFINSDHAAILKLVRELRLELLDYKTAELNRLQPRFIIDGVLRTEAEIVEGLRPVVVAMQPDLKRLEAENEAATAELDRLSMADYLQRKGVSGWLYSLLQGAFVPEFGLELEEQTSLNLFELISPRPRARSVVTYTDLMMAGSDERYMVKGGNQRITDALAQRLPVKLKHRLVRLVDGGTAYGLTFDTDVGARDVVADVVILTLPFSVLREVELRVDMPPLKRRAIKEMGYGTNAKVVVGASRRVWSEHGLNGSTYRENDLQLTWDDTLRQPTEAGSLTCFTGGRLGLSVSAGSVESQARRLLRDIDKALPGVSSVLTGRALRMYWPGYRHALGSYSCLKPGQWSTFNEVAAQPVGRGLHFAGEHTSDQYAGFMNGGADSGLRAAREVSARVRSVRRR